MTDPNRECIKVTLAVIPTTDLPPPTSTTTTGTSVPATTLTTLTTSTTTSTSTTPATNGYTDLTAQGYRFLGCSPEERWTTDGAFRTLSGAMQSTDTNTNAGCVAFCAAAGFSYAGTECKLPILIQFTPISPPCVAKVWCVRLAFLSHNVVLCRGF